MYSAEERVAATLVRRALNQVAMSVANQTDADSPVREAAASLIAELRTSLPEGPMDEAITLYPNRETIQMVLLRELSVDLQSPVRYRTMTKASLSNLRRRINSVNHPWYGCDIISEMEDRALVVYVQAPTAALD